MNRPFDSVIIVDWSASATPSPRRPTADAIWIGMASAQGETTTYHRTRADAEAALTRILDAETAAGRRVLAGFDFPFGYPQGFAERLTGTAGAGAVWHWMQHNVTDSPTNENNRFAVAARINAMFAAPGPFWGRPQSLPLPGLSERKNADYPAVGLAERRRVETLVRGAQPVWKLFTTGSVGSQALMGLPMIARLAARHRASVWPFDAPGLLTLAEVYPSLINAAVRPAVATGEIKDAAQVRLLARALRHLSATGRLDTLLNDVPDWPGRADEGWILGAGHAPLLAQALS